MPNYKINPNTTQHYLDRVDPYWGHIWSVPSQETGTTWHDRRSMSKLVELGFIRLKSSEQKWSVDEAYEHMASSSYRDLYLKLIAATFMWRTLTQEQIGAIIGWSGLKAERNDPHLIMIPWSAEILQWGHPSDFAKPLRLVRPAYDIPDRFLESLTYSERLAVFGGQNAVMHGRMARHNVLNAEVSLRVAEHLDHLFPIILGEGSSFAKVLLPDAQNRSPSYSVGDAVWVRSDGLRVIVETGNKADSIIGKIKRWASTLSEDARQHKSLYLLFVIPNHYQRSDWVKHAKEKIATGVFSELGSKGFDAKYLASRVGIVEWAEWFPGYHEINGDMFQSLQVWQLDRNQSWHLTSLADPYVIECEADQADVDKTLAYARNLYGIPYFLRDQPADLSQDLLQLAERLVQAKIAPLRETAEQQIQQLREA